jgi:hypothetical protein
MAKINLNNLPFEEAMTVVRKFQKNVYKNGINSWGNDDPYMHEARLEKKFIVSQELSTKIIDTLIESKNRMSCYVEHFRVRKDMKE